MVSSSRGSVVISSTSGWDLSSHRHLTTGCRVWERTLTTGISIRACEFGLTKLNLLMSFLYVALT